MSDRSFFAEIAKSGAPDAVHYIDLMQVGSAEWFYAADYLAHKLTGAGMRAVATYAIGSRIAECLREAIDDRMPKKCP